MNETQLRAKMTIGDNEKILAVVRHHWFAYLGIYLMTGLFLALLVGFLLVLVAVKNSMGISDQIITYIGIGIVIFGAVAVLFSLIPLYIRKQETLVLTEESLVLLEKPSLFSNNTSQLNLQHVSDVTVHQDMLGSMMGYGKLSVETPGEQDNYEFTVVAAPREVAKKIVEAHENYVAALESGQIRTTLSQRPPVPGTAWRPDAEVPENPAVPPAPIQPEQPPTAAEPPTPENTLVDTPLPPPSAES